MAPDAGHSPETMDEGPVSYRGDKFHRSTQPYALLRTMDHFDGKKVEHYKY